MISGLRRMPAGAFAGGCTTAAALPMQICGAAAHALGEGVDLADAVQGVEEFVGDALGLVTLGGQVEGASRFAHDAGAALDDSKVTHALAGPPVGHLNSPSFMSRSDLARSRPSDVT